jgi:hypothetical protein
MKNQMFKIWDLQNYQYFHDWEWFTDRTWREALASFHSVDYSWQLPAQDECWNELRDENWEVVFEDCTIYEFLDTIETDVWKMEWLMEYWMWDIHYYICHWKNDEVVWWSINDEEIMERERDSVEVRYAQ